MLLWCGPALTCTLVNKNGPSAKQFAHPCYSVIAQQINTLVLSCLTFSLSNVSPLTNSLRSIFDILSYLMLIQVLTRCFRTSIRSILCACSFTGRCAMRKAAGASTEQTGTSTARSSSTASFLTSTRDLMLYLCFLPSTLIY